MSLFQIRECAIWKLWSFQIQKVCHFQIRKTYRFQIWIMWFFQIQMPLIFITSGTPYIIDKTCTIALVSKTNIDWNPEAWGTQRLSITLKFLTSLSASTNRKIWLLMFFAWSHCEALTNLMMIKGRNFVYIIPGFK